MLTKQKWNFPRHVPFLPTYERGGSIFLTRFNNGWMNRSWQISFGWFHVMNSRLDDLQISQRRLRVLRRWLRGWARCTLGWIGFVNDSRLMVSHLRGWIVPFFHWSCRPYHRSWFVICWSVRKHRLGVHFRLEYWLLIMMVIIGLFLFDDRLDRLRMNNRWIHYWHMINWALINRSLVFRFDILNRLFWHVRRITRLVHILEFLGWLIHHMMDVVLRIRWWSIGPHVIHFHVRR